MQDSRKDSWQPPQPTSSGRLTTQSPPSFAKLSTAHHLSALSRPRIAINTLTRPTVSLALVRTCWLQGQDGTTVTSERNEHQTPGGPAACLSSQSLSNLDPRTLTEAFALPSMQRLRASRYLRPRISARPSGRGIRASSAQNTPPTSCSRPHAWLPGPRMPSLGAQTALADSPNAS